MPLTLTRTIAVTIALGASVGLAACGGSSESTATTSTTSSQTVTTTTKSTPARLSPAAAAAFKGALTAYAACMRRNGIDLPPPKTNAQGQPALTTAGVNTSSKPFFAAFGKCRAFVRKLYEVPHP